jgi:hypothetical protein
MKARLVVALLFASSCTCGETPLLPGEILGDGFAAARAVDSQTVEVTFQRALDAGSVKSSAFDIADFTVLPADAVSVRNATLEGDRKVSLGTEPLSAGVRYTLTVAGLKDSQGRALAGTINFVASGAGDVVEVTVVVQDVQTARLHDQLVVMATLDDEGRFSETLEAFPLVEQGGQFLALLPARIDASRTLQSGDDDDLVVDRRAYALMLMDGAGRAASALVRFALPDADAAREVLVDVQPPVEVVDPGVPDRIPDPPEDDAPGDGLRVVRIVVDDRASHELVNPSVRVAFDAGGNFDASFPETLPLSPMDGEDEGFWQAVVRVRVDPNRVADGATNETFPYFAYLVEQGAPYEGLDVAITAPDETPVTAKIGLGTEGWTPVTFTVDASRAYLTPDGSARGVYPGEAVFLTGEWQQASDALQNNCGDAFTGGENACLEMRELAAHDGVWTRTLWLPPGRPYGWKVVRCASTVGCGPLNQLVASSGRAFATVMKNLATDNVDAFSDPGVGLVDPLAPASTQAAGQSYDYTSADVHVGTGTGGEEDPSGTPDGARMFKQEVPDLVVVVGADALRTRVFHVGTWRDVNLPNTPQEIVAGQLSTPLTPYDYDDGFIGRFPPSREAP